MKKHRFFFFAMTLMIATACQTKTATDNTEVETTPIPIEPEAISDGTYCYEYRQGQDVTMINLNLTGDVVTGEMNWIPYEKDGARGTLAGTRSGNEIKGIWSYVIEGSAQTEEVIFNIEGDQLLRKIGELEDPNFDGNLKLKDPESATLSEAFTRITCE